MFAMFALSPDKILPVPMGGAEPQGLLRAENPPKEDPPQRTLRTPFPHPDAPPLSGGLIFKDLEITDIR